MTTTRSTEKRRRAAEFPSRPGPTPNAGVLQVQWASAFDRSCFLVTTPNLQARHRKAYDQLMTELTSETGCNEEEILAHGHKVRAILYFAEDRLSRTGALAGLVGRQKHDFELAPVRPAF